MRLTPSICAIVLPRISRESLIFGRVINMVPCGALTLWYHFHTRRYNSVVSHTITAMKLQRQRAYKLDDTRWQYKYVITVPETLIDQLGWKTGSELQATVKESSLVVNFVSSPSGKSKRIVAAKMTYEEFRDKIKGVLQYNDKGMTCTQVRARLKLDQVVPNNKWVRRMEKDIGLMRVKGTDGVIVWRVNHVR
jgi:antitoxin component of MazEF toxin-antitoxin module